MPKRLACKRMTPHPQMKGKWKRDLCGGSTSKNTAFVCGSLEALWPRYNRASPWYDSLLPGLCFAVRVYPLYASGLGNSNIHFLYSSLFSGLLRSIVSILITCWTGNMLHKPISLVSKANSPY